MNKNAQINDSDQIYWHYTNSPYLTIKHSSYFQVYEEILEKYRNKKITFIEVGVLNGGSLFMWRTFFGKDARIIGVDFNPTATKWVKDGFEIFIGDQGNEEFWKSLFAKIGNVDVILDDGGHTNLQQIITAEQCIPNINDGGILIVEDVHASYMHDFGNPSKYSFINYCKRLVDGVNSRFPGIHSSINPLKNIIYSIVFYESIVCFKVDRKKCFTPKPTSNHGISMDAEDFRFQHSGLKKVLHIKDKISSALFFIKKYPLLKQMLHAASKTIYFLNEKIISFQTRKYFK